MGAELVKVCRRLLNLSSNFVHGISCCRRRKSGRTTVLSEITLLFIMSSSNNECSKYRRQIKQKWCVRNCFRSCNVWHLIVLPSWYYRRIIQMPSAPSDRPSDKDV